MNEVDRLRKEAARDAIRFMEAKMDYGRGSGNKRKIIDAEVKDKMKSDIYRLAFEAALQTIDEGEIVRRIQGKKHLEKAYVGAKKTYRVARRAEVFYNNNRGWINKILDAIFG